jgi:hypothetical protein
MADNAHTYFVWSTFMKNPEAQRGMDRAGIKLDQNSPGYLRRTAPAKTVR